MVSQSKPSVNVALCLTAMCLTPLFVQAQISAAPHRYRHKVEYNNSEMFGRESRQQSGRQQQNYHEKKKRKLDAFSMPLQESRPSSHEAEFDLSMPSTQIQESELDLSMPLGQLPAQIDEDDVEAVTLGNDGDSNSGTPLLASFLAGISALAVGSVALIGKMRQKRECQDSESQQEIEDLQRPATISAFNSDMQGRIVSFDAWEDPNIEGEMRDINIA